MSIDVFVSHSSSDKTLATALVAALRSCLNADDLQIRCSTLPQAAPEPGQCFDEAAVRKEIESAKVFIWLATKAAIASAPVLFEVTTRRHSGTEDDTRRVLPVVVDPKLQLPWPFTQLQSVRCQDWCHLETLVQYVAKRLGRKYERNAESLTSLSELAELSLRNRDALLAAIVNRNELLNLQAGVSPKGEG
jgi:hypothetical protein